MTVDVAISDRPERIDASARVEIVPLLRLSRFDAPACGGIRRLRTSTWP
jgi:hypothetical protein